MENDLLKANLDAQFELLKKNMKKYARKTKHSATKPFSRLQIKRDTFVDPNNCNDMLELAAGADRLIELGTRAQ